MNSDRWQQIKEVFGDALQRAPSKRVEYLAEACGKDDELRAEVEKLLASYATEFMAQPAVGEVADLIVNAQWQLKAGQRLGRYRIGQPIGAGGMGDVYLANDMELDRDVPPRHARVTKIFLRSGKMLTQIFQCSKAPK